MNFLAIQNFLFERIRNNTAARAVNLKAVINIAMRAAVAERELQQLILERTKATVANQYSGYVLNDTEIDFISKAWVISEAEPLIEMSIEVMRERFPDPTDFSTDCPRFFAVERITPVLTQPTSTSVVTIASSTADTAKIRVTGLSNSVRMQDEITLNGTTPVAGTVSFTEIFAIEKSATTTGKVTCTSNAAAVTLCNISPGALGSRYISLRLHPIPDTIYTINLQCPRIIYDMVADNDVPGDIHDEDFHNLVLATAESILMKDPMLLQAAKNASNEKSKIQGNVGFRTIDRRSYRDNMDTGKRYQ